MSYAISTIVSDVQKTIDEIALNDAEFVGGSDNAEMVEIIKSKVVDAATYILDHADSSLIEPDETITDGGTLVAVKDADGNIVCTVLRVPLAKRMLRFQKAKCDSWPYYVTDVIQWSDGDYAKLRDKYTTGTYQRPKVGFVRGSGKDVIELYCPKQTDEAYEVSVVYIPTISSENEVNVPSRLYTPLVYYTAGLTLLTYGEQRADDMFNQALVMMGINPTAGQTQQQ